MFSSPFSVFLDLFFLRVCLCVVLCVRAQKHVLLFLLLWDIDLKLTIYNDDDYDDDDDDD